MTARDIVQARHDATMARQRLQADVQHLRERTSPSFVARETGQQLVDKARSRPGPVIAAGAAALLLLVFPPLRHLAWRNRGRIGQFITLRFSAPRPADDRTKKEIGQ